MRLPAVAAVNAETPTARGQCLPRRILLVEDNDDVRETLRAVKLIALSGYGQPGDAERARASGFDAYLVKPADGDRLAAAIAEIP